MSNIIFINEPYVHYTVKDITHTFIVAMSDLIDNDIAHEYDDSADSIDLVFTLYNPQTNNSVKVKSVHSSSSQRIYNNTSNPDRIIQLIVT